MPTQDATWDARTPAAPAFWAFQTFSANLQGVLPLPSAPAQHKHMRRLRVNRELHLCCVRCVWCAAIMKLQQLRTWPTVNQHDILGLLVQG